MPRPFTRAQALQNHAFLAALRRSGNARLAARELGVHRSTFTKRRARDPAFAAEWDGALALASAALRTPRAPRVLRNVPADHATRTTGGEPHVVQLPGGRVQLRRAAPGRMTKAAEQAFFAALSATANVRLAAAAAGFSHASFYARARSDPAFAREMRLAHQLGYERLEFALIESMDPAAHVDDAWRHNDPPPIPAITGAQALQLLSLHAKTVKLGWERPDRRRRRGETSDAWADRLHGLWQRDRMIDAEDAAIAAAAAREPAGDGPLPHEPPAPVLPSFDVVKARLAAKRPRGAPPAIFPEEAETANGRTRVRDPETAMFGGWRLVSDGPGGTGAGACNTEGLSLCLGPLLAFLGGPPRE